MMIAPAPTRSTTRNGNPDRLMLGGVAVTGRSSLTLKVGLVLDDWRRIGLHLSRISDSSIWWLGDWLIYGRERYPDRYKQTIKDTSLDYQTLRNYAWVAGRVGAERRREGLSFQHHAEVASLSEHIQDQWLAKAEADGWSRNRLRAEMKQLTESSRAEAKTVQLRVEDAHLTRWKQAAVREGRELLEWMVQILDEAAEPLTDTAAIAV